MSDKEHLHREGRGYEGIIFGRHPVLEALERGEKLEKVLLLQGTRGELEIKLRQACKVNKVPLVMVPKEKLQRILPMGSNHQGVAAFMPAIEYADWPILVEELKDWVGERPPLLLILDGVTDVRNLGAVARSAEALGVDALILPKKGSAAVNGEAVKASAGALNMLSVYRVENLERSLDELRDLGFRLAAADLRGGEALDVADLSGALALVLGGEDRGVRPHLLKKCDVHFHIPMRGRTDSFNVSVAAGICLYEIDCQRRAMELGELGGLA